jgi:hypothetical protein
VFVELYVMNLKYDMVILLLIYSSFFDLVDCIFVCMLFAPVSRDVICSAWWRAVFNRHMCAAI